MHRVLVLVLLVACRGGGSDAPPCGAVGAKFYALAKDELATAKVDEATARAVTDQLPALRDSLTNACRDGAWSADVRRCLGTATTKAEVEACERQLTEGQRRALDRAALGLEPEPK